MSGACLMAREMAEEKRLGDYLLLDEQMVTSQVAVNLYAEAKQQKVVLVEAGVPWYLVDEELELIPSGETELALQTKNVLTQKEKQFMISRNFHHCQMREDFSFRQQPFFFVEYGVQ